MVFMMESKTKYTTAQKIYILQTLVTGTKPNRSSFDLTEDLSNAIRLFYKNPTRTFYALPREGDNRDMPIELVSEKPTDELAFTTFPLDEIKGPDTLPTQIRRFLEKEKTDKFVTTFEQIKITDISNLNCQTISPNETLLAILHAIESAHLKVNRGGKLTQDGKLMPHGAAMMYDVVTDALKNGTELQTTLGSIKTILEDRPIKKLGLFGLGKREGETIDLYNKIYALAQKTPNRIHYIEENRFSNKT